jgi:hypothetical protein
MKYLCWVTAIVFINAIVVFIILHRRRERTKTELRARLGQRGNLTFAEFMNRMPPEMHGWTNATQLVRACISESLKLDESTIAPNDHIIEDLIVPTVLDEPAEDEEDLYEAIQQELRRRSATPLPNKYRWTTVSALIAAVHECLSADIMRRT